VKRPLKLLLVEDVEDDAEVVRRELDQGGFEVRMRRVETREELEQALEDQSWDFIIADYAMPKFSGLAALELVRARALDIPFIIVSGAIGEDTAVLAMKGGAHDYLLKGNLKRLAPAVARELREAEGRASSRATKLALERSLHALVDRAPEPIALIRDDRLAHVNPPLVQMLRYSKAASLIGQPAQSLFVLGKDASFARQIDSALRGDAGFPNPLHVRTHDGQSREVEVGSIPVVLEGAPATALWLRDVTHQRALALKLVEANRMVAVGGLAAGIGHEVSDPLAFVMANIRYLGEELHALEAPSPEGVAEQLRELQQVVKESLEGVERVRRIVTDLKTFAITAEEGERLVDVERVLDAVIRMTLTELNNKARVVRLYGHPPWVMANEGRLGQVFFNLVTHALGSIPEGQSARHEIRLRTWAEEGRSCVRVEDTGPGLSAEQLAHLFDGLFHSRNESSASLGLSITRQIVQQLGGDVEVRTALGQGTSLTVRLPSGSQAPARVTRTQAAPVPAPGRARVLFVDDEPMMGSALQRTLGKQHELTVLQSAREALTQIQDGQRYDVILCDLMMPDMTGMELHEALMNISPPHAGRMVFVTGGAYTPSAKRFFDKVVNLRLEKPLAVGQLNDVISKVLSAPPPMANP
jgi:signal transduction histidine kinase/response regulator of citrate/malate metabolism